MGTTNRQEVDAMMPTMMTDLENVRAHRAELRACCLALDDAVATPIRLTERWHTRVLAAMTELSHDFRDHVTLTEAPDGLYARVQASDPRLSSAVGVLVEEHAAFTERIAQLLGQVDRSRGSSIEEVRELREQLTALVGDLVRHRQRGGDLVYEAFEVDLGGSD